MLQLRLQEEVEPRGSEEHTIPTLHPMQLLLSQCLPFSFQVLQLMLYSWDMYLSHWDKPLTWGSIFWLASLSPWTSLLSMSPCTISSLKAPHPIWLFWMTLGCFLRLRTTPFLILLKMSLLTLLLFPLILYDSLEEVKWSRSVVSDSLRPHGL